MQFSIAKLLLVTLFINFIVAASFAFPPVIGFPLVTFICLFVIPPFIVVGAVNTRGIRQSFFLGAMVAGVPHFIVSAYMAIMVGFTLSGADWSDFTEMESPMRYMHVLGLLIGALGGVSGMASFYFLKYGPKQSPSKPQTINGSATDPLAEETPIAKEPISIPTEPDSFATIDAPLPR
jgi:hypothetical protein